MYVHENNIDNKIKTDYKGLKSKIQTFKDEVYIPMRIEIEKIDFSDTDYKTVYQKATNHINDYRQRLKEFAAENKIDSRSKFESTFLEEINYYLFKDIEQIKDNSLTVFNKDVYAGLKIKDDLNISILTKDVDFCIGREVEVEFNNNVTEKLRIPAVSVEVKTYLDATMFGEIKSSSKTLKSATPNSKAYVLMGYKDLADEHIFAAMQDSTLDQMYVLQKNKHSEIDYQTLYEYYSDVVKAIGLLGTPPSINVPGRLLY